MKFFCKFLQFSRAILPITNALLNSRIHNFYCMYAKNGPWWSSKKNHQITVCNRSTRFTDGFFGIQEQIHYYLIYLILVKCARNFKFNKIKFSKNFQSLWIFRVPNRLRRNGVPGRLWRQCRCRCGASSAVVACRRRCTARRWRRGTWSPSGGTACTPTPSRSGRDGCRDRLGSRWNPERGGRIRMREFKFTFSWIRSPSTERNSSKSAFDVALPNSSSSVVCPNFW